MARLSLLSSIVWLASLLIHCPFASTQCSDAGGVAPKQKALNHVKTAFLDLGKPNETLPIGITYARQPGYAFVSAIEQHKGNISSHVLLLNTTDFPPKVAHSYQIPPKESTLAYEVALSPDGAYLYVAAGEGVVIVDTEQAVKLGAKPFAGYLNGSSTGQYPGKLAFGITASPNEHYVVISQEDGPQPEEETEGNIDAFRLQSPDAHGNVKGQPIGFETLGYLVTGGVFSPDAQRFYAVSEVTAGPHTNASLGNRGSVSVLDVSTLEKDPAKSLLGNITVDCGTVRAVVSSDGETLWVANRGSNTVAIFNTSLILSDPTKARIATVQIGTSPVGLIFVANETRLLVSNSNRFAALGTMPNATSGISVVNVAEALAGSRHANLGQIPSGLFPRDFAISPDGKTVLVSNTNSAQVMAIDVDTLP